MQSNINNRTIFCHDNLGVLQGMNTDSIDLVYLDPPFNKKKVFTAKLGSAAQGARFSDIFRQEDIKDDWLLTIKEDADDIYLMLESVKQIEGRASYNFCYLAYMAIRLIECHRVLKEAGSLYLHCDPTMSHYLKILLDYIFGEKNFRNEIVWCYSGPAKATKNFTRKHDTVFYYAKDHKFAPFNHDFVRIQHKRLTVSGGVGMAAGKRTLAQVQAAEAKQIKIGKLCPDWWHDIGAGSHISKIERTGYPTQKPLALMERIIKASSKAGDVVLDPFCGCATTCVAAERLGRRWVGIDVSRKTFDLVRQRLGKEVAWKNTLFEEEMVTFRTDPPQRTDLGDDERLQKYVYIIANHQYPGEYKVGITSNVKRRLSSYQTGDPNREYCLEYQRLTPHFREIEEKIHARYENKHEWVCGDLAAIKESIEAYHHECERNHS